LPQGSLKKIDFNLLAANLAFQIGNASLCRSQRRLGRWLRWLWPPKILALWRSAPTAQRFRPTGTEPISPLIKIFSTDAQLLSQGADILPSQHPL